MNKVASVINASGDYEEAIERLAKHLGKSTVRRKIFNCIYGRGTKPKTVEDLAAVLDDVPLQSIRNELNRLSGHHLILQSVIKTKSGRSLAGYSKQEFVRVNRDRIVRMADDPAYARSVSTKRRPQMLASAFDASVSIVRTPVKSRTGSSKRVSTAKVLYLTATPSSQHPLRTDAEVSQVQQAVRGSKFREKIEILSSPAASPRSLIDGLNDHQPQIVHFSGHGGAGGVWFDDGKVENSQGQDVSFELLAELFNATSTPPVMVVFNACDTLDGAEALLESVSAVVAMSASISDLGATTFAVQLYGTIAAGETVTNAVNQGIVAMKLSTLFEDAELPKMICREDFDPAKFRVVR